MVGYSCLAAREAADLLAKIRFAGVFFSDETTRSGSWSTKLARFELLPDSRLAWVDHLWSRGSRLGLKIRYQSASFCRREWKLSIVDPKDRIHRGLLFAPNSRWTLLVDAG